MRKEKWKDIEGFEGLYRISNYGNVKSLSRTIFIGHDKKTIKIIPEIILSPSPRGKYLRVALSKNGIQKDYSIHLIVAKHFVLNPKNKRYVDHIWGNKFDNRAWMLEWVTSGENQKRAYKLGLRVPPMHRVGQSGKLHSKSVPVIAIKDGKEQTFESQHLASKALKVSQGNINMVLHGIRPLASGYKFIFG